MGKFVELVAAGSQAIRELDPQATIISGDDVMANNYHFLALGMGKYVDGITIHPYNYKAGPPEGTTLGTPEQVERDGVVVADDSTYLSMIRHLRQAAPGKQIWVTEFGCITPPTRSPEEDFWWGVTEDTQAKYLARFYLMNFALGVERILQHTFQDGGDGPFGIVRSDFSPKPAYFVLGRIFGLFDNSWKKANDVNIELSGKFPVLPDRNPNSKEPERGFYAYAWRQRDTGQLAVAFWNACLPESHYPPLGRTLKIHAPGYGHAIKIDLLDGSHPDCPPTRVEADGTMVWEEMAVPDYPILIKLFADRP